MCPSHLFEEDLALFLTAPSVGLAIHLTPSIFRNFALPVASTSYYELLALFPHRFCGPILFDF